jgi:hypothetical protein
MKLEDLQNAVPSLSDSDIAALEGTIQQARAARVDAQNAALLEFPWVVGLTGHSVPVQVTRSAAITLLAAGSHKLYGPDGGQAA